MLFPAESQTRMELDGEFPESPARLRSPQERILGPRQDAWVALPCANYLRDHVSRCRLNQLSALIHSQPPPDITTTTLRNSGIPLDFALIFVAQRGRETRVLGSIHPAQRPSKAGVRACDRFRRPSPKPDQSQPQDERANVLMFWSVCSATTGCRMLQGPSFCPPSGIMPLGFNATVLRQIG